MHPRRRASSCLLLLAATTIAFVVTPVEDPPAAAATAPYSFAVIGDVPYGTTAETHFPVFVSGINADPDVAMVTHLGDIKNGSSTCDDARFARVRSGFGLVADPLVYTPGDNEWTDCHRVDNGRYQPLERLARIRSMFFTTPGLTLGATPVSVTSQASIGFPENVRYTRAQLSFATLHVVGSNNDLKKWSGLGFTAPTAAQLAEQSSRMSATIANLRGAFATAKSQGLLGVVLQQQADMFDMTVASPSWSSYSAFKPLVQAILDEARAFGKPVYLFNGDSHRYRDDHPLASGSKWLGFYGVTGTASNVRRITVDGERLGESDWLKVTVSPTGTLTMRRVPGA
jgi:hypothetical protein